MKGFFKGSIGPQDKAPSETDETEPQAKVFRASEYALERTPKPILGVTLKHCKPSINTLGLEPNFSMRSRCFVSFFFCILLTAQVQAQNLQKLYDLSVDAKKRLEQEDKDKKTKTEDFYTEAKANGQYWKCDKNLFIFYRGYVLAGAKEDGSDMGKSPYDLIGNYQVVNNQFINFNFPTLPYDNIFELNIAKGEAVVFKKSLNRLEKLACTFLK